MFDEGGREGRMTRRLRTTMTSRRRKRKGGREGGRDAKLIVYRQRGREGEREGGREGETQTRSIKKYPCEFFVYFFLFISPAAATAAVALFQNDFP